jgi:O-acetyl-ADP-ribose deacetylase (regulator of RNase III)
MIRFASGNLLDSDAEALVNAVNTVGVMGKGIALMFKKAFPDNYRAYRVACNEGKVNVGHMFVYERAAAGSPRWIINFPTKMHWRNPSRLEWIREGLQDLRRVARKHEIRSIAIPPLGAGLGGLDWNDVRREIEQAFSDFDGVDVIVYEPTDTYHMGAEGTVSTDRRSR